MRITDLLDRRSIDLNGTPKKKEGSAGPDGRPHGKE